MTPKEKAEELIEKFIEFSDTDFDAVGCPIYSSQIKSAKQCALIAVDEIIAAVKHALDYFDITRDFGAEPNFWQQVKSEIEKL
jgi:hypothetical protein